MTSLSSSHFPSLLWRVCEVVHRWENWRSSKNRKYIDGLEKAFSWLPKSSKNTTMNPTIIISNFITTTNSLENNKTFGFESLLPSAAALPHGISVLDNRIQAWPTRTRKYKYDKLACSGFALRQTHICYSQRPTVYRKYVRSKKKSSRAAGLTNKRPNLSGLPLPTCSCPCGQQKPTPSGLNHHCKLLPKNVNVRYSLKLWDFSFTWSWNTKTTMSTLEQRLVNNKSLQQEMLVV